MDDSEEEFSIREPDVWDLDLSDYVSDNKKNYQLIKTVNDKIPLSSVIFQHNIKFAKKYSPGGWTHFSCCPFKDHNDRTPSFGYNSKEERFNCFGCSRSGKTVEFLAYLKNRSLLEVAKELIKNISPSYEESVLLLEEHDDKRVRELLLSFSIEIHNYLLKFPNKLSEVIKITQIIDLYLMKNVMGGTIVYEEFLEYVKICRRSLSELNE